MLIVRGVVLDATWMRSDKRSPRVRDARLSTDKDARCHPDLRVDRRHLVQRCAPDSGWGVHSLVDDFDASASQRGERTVQSRRRGSLKPTMVKTINSPAGERVRLHSTL
jgi:hypothetical protein